MDNVSFFYSSELSISVPNGAVAKDLRVRLCKEHLGSFYSGDSFDAAFIAFRKAANSNLASLRSDMLVARPVFLTPLENYRFLMKKVSVDSSMNRLLDRLRLRPQRLKDALSKAGDSMRASIVENMIVAKL